jgi:pimeloyl-ACP methyl ester carboxylesterase
VALLEAIGPSVLIVHSAAGLTAVEALRARPDLVKALIMIEPVGSPTAPAEVKSLLAGTPYLAVFGDHFDVRSMQGRYEACVETARLIADAGGRAKVIRLPDTGVKGNTHLLMQDRNSHDIARLIIDWLAGRN